MNKSKVIIRSSKPKKPENLEIQPRMQLDQLIKTMPAEEVNVLLSQIRSHRVTIDMTLERLLAGKAWVALGYGSFRELCLKELTDYDYTTLIKRKQAIEMHQILEPEVPFGYLPEYFYRPLRQIPAEHRVTAWNDAKNKAGGLESIRIVHIKRAVNDVTLAISEETQNKKLLVHKSPDHSFIVDGLVQSARLLIKKAPISTKRNLKAILKDLSNMLIDDFKNRI